MNYFNKLSVLGDVAPPTRDASLVQSVGAASGAVEQAIVPDDDDDTEDSGPMQLVEPPAAGRRSIDDAADDKAPKIARITE